jgi:hypothetical protein
MSQILIWSYNYCTKAPEKKIGLKTQKKIIICRVPNLAPGKEAFAGCQLRRHPAKNFFKKIKKFLCQVPAR